MIDEEEKICPNYLSYCFEVDWIRAAADFDLCIGSAATDDLARAVDSFLFDTLLLAKFVPADADLLLALLNLVGKSSILVSTSLFGISGILVSLDAALLLLLSSLTRREAGGADGTAFELFKLLGVRYF